MTAETFAVIDKIIVATLITLVESQSHGTRKQAAEQAWILNEYEKLASGEASWSEQEWEWFINRILTHMAAK